MYKRIEKSVTGVGGTGANKKGKEDREKKTILCCLSP